MSKILYFIKNNKILFGLCIYFALVILLDLSLLIFNLVQLLHTNQNVATLSDCFFAFNVSVCVINFAAIVLLVVFLILRRKIKKTSE